MPGVTAAQLELARSVDLLSYLQANEPQELRRSSANEYRTVGHGSLVISNGKWFWNRGGFGGVSALDYLVRVRGIGFVAAVEAACGGRQSAEYFPLSAERSRREGKVARSNGAAAQDDGGVSREERSIAHDGGVTARKALVLPPPVRFPARMVAYLQERGISADVIRRCISDGTLYESRYRDSPVCVFVGRDETSAARFACVRGIGTDLKQDCAGSDKRFSFALPARNSDSEKVVVTESPIDAMSHACLFPGFGGHRLSLGGTSDVALRAFLERKPQVSEVSLCLDNDAAGRSATERIRVMLATDYPHIGVTVAPPETGKDYNALLVHKKTTKREQKNAGHRKVSGVSF